MSGAPFWPLSAGLLQLYPPLSTDQTCQVAVVGAGITGALVADALAGAGSDVVVLDRRDVAAGSTAASTALLSYELDIELLELSERVGEAAARRAYQLSHAAIGRLEALAAELGDDCGFRRCASLYLASDRADTPRLEREARAREAAGLPVEFWDRRRIAEHYEVRAGAALRSPVAGEVDPYRLTHRLLERAASRGARIFDRTAVLSCEKRGRHNILRTSREATVQAERVIFAPGYEVPKPLREELVELSTTYAIVTEPLASFPGWEDRCLVWETRRPYHYLRSTGDGRIILGGGDEPCRDPARSGKDLSEKASALAAQLRRWLPSIDAEPAFAWSGIFGSSPDGLPYVGEWPAAPGQIFALGYGGNGITFALVAADLLRDCCLGRPNPDTEIFRLDR